MPDDSLRQILLSTIDTKSPTSEDLFGRINDNLNLLNALISSITTGILAGSADSVTVGTIVDTDPTSGKFSHDDQYNGLYLRFTSGAVFTNNNLNQFKITDTIASSSSLVVAEDLAALGALATHTYVILGHTHDGDSSDPTGAAIDFKNLANIAEGLKLTQDISNAFFDPDSNRPNASDRDNPFSTLNDTNKSFEYDAQSGSTEIQRGGTNVLMTRASAGTTDAEVDISSIVPLGTRVVQIVGGASYSGNSRNLEWHIYNTDSPQTGFGASRLIAQADSNVGGTKRFNGFVGPLAGSDSTDNVTTQIFTCPVTIDRKVKLKLVASAGVTTIQWAIVGWTK